MWTITVVYIAGAVWLASTAATPVWGLELNEVGDFAAGAAAPLAFLWLVYTAHLQRRELQLQIAELSNLVGNAEKQADALIAQVNLQEAERREREHARVRAQAPQLSTHLERAPSRRSEETGRPVFVWELRIVKVSVPARLLSAHASGDVEVQDPGYEGRLIDSSTRVLLTRPLPQLPDEFTVTIMMMTEGHLVWSQVSTWDGKYWGDGTPSLAVAPPAT